MDEVTQRNAANAEETASASEELSDQAESMNATVDQLAGLVGRATSRRSIEHGRGKLNTGLDRATVRNACKIPSRGSRLDRSDSALDKVTARDVINC